MLGGWLLDRYVVGVCTRKKEGAVVAYEWSTDWYQETHEESVVPVGIRRQRRGTMADALAVKQAIFHRFGVRIPGS